MPRDTEDVLGQQVAAIEAWSRANGLALIAGSVENGEHVATVHWATADDVASWRGYLEQAKQLGTGFVVLEEMRLLREDWETALAEAREGGDDEGEADLAECKKHIGHSGSITLSWFAPSQPGVVFAWELATPWFIAFYGANEDADNTPAPTELSHGRIDELATKLAHDPHFHTLWDHRDRRDAARAILPPDVAQNEQHMQSVVWGAEDIFKSQIKPALEKSPEVQELARRLAHDPGFQRAKNRKQREYAAQQMLGAEGAQNQTKLQVVIEHATTIYEIDLRKGRSPAH